MRSFTAPATRERHRDGLRAIPGYRAEPAEGDGVKGQRWQISYY
jgi:hypothetical protein